MHVSEGGQVAGHWIMRAKDKRVRDRRHRELFGSVEARLHEPLLQTNCSYWETKPRTVRIKLSQSASIDSLGHRG